MRTAKSILPLALTLLLGAGPTEAQQYRSGSHRISAPQGTLVINSGFVNHLNAHTFHVYTFLFKPSAAGQEWQQVPVTGGDSGAGLNFTLTTSNSADFTLRDAKVSVSAGRVVLQVAQKKYQSTPYDDNATVEVTLYELQQTRDEGRWIFRRVGARNVGTDVSVEQSLSSPDSHSRVKR